MIPAGKTAAALNFDMYMPFGRPNDVTVNGAERTTMYPNRGGGCQAYELKISPDPRPSAGTYYRSDHFSFARVGIPAFSIDHGQDLAGKPAGTGKKLFDEFNDKHYHQPSDEYHEDWDFAGMEYVCALRIPDRRECCEHAQVADLESGRRVSSGSRFQRSEVTASRSDFRSLV